MITYFIRSFIYNSYSQFIAIVMKWKEKKLISFSMASGAAASTISNALFLYLFSSLPFY